MVWCTSFSFLLPRSRPLTREPSAQAIASLGPDLILAGLPFSLAIGTTIACCLFSTDLGLHAGMKIAAYFWMLSALLAWWRVTVYLIEEVYGPNSVVTKFFPIFRTPLEKRAPLVMPGLGEPGVKRGVPKMVEGDSAYGAITATRGAYHGPTNGVTYDTADGAGI